MASSNSIVPFDYYERLRRQQQSQAENDPVSQTVRSLREQQYRSELQNTASPDAVAKATRIARDAGEAPGVIEGREDEVARHLDSARTAQVVAANPGFAAWAQSNPRGLSAAQDDHKSLGLLGSAWDTIKKLPATGVAAVHSLGVQGAKANDALADFFGNLGDTLESIATPGSMTVGEMEARQAGRRNYWRGGIQAAQTSLDKSRPAYTGFIQQNVLQGLETVPSSLVALGFGVATRNPEAALALMGTQSGLPAYSDARSAGKGSFDALRYGLTQGSIEALTEKIPASSLVEAIAKRTPFGKSLVRQLGEEIPGEQVATVLQDYSEWATLNPDKPFSAYMAERPSAALSTLIGTVTGTAAQTAVVHAASRGAKAAAQVGPRIAESQQAKAEGSVFDQAAKAAEQSKLRARDPEAYNDVVRHQAEEAGTPHVFVSGEALQAYMQSDSYDQYEGEFKDYASHIAEAVATGGDVVLPAEFALGTLPGTPAWAALKDDMRLTPGGISPREAQTFDEHMADIVAEMSDRMDQSEKATKANRTAIETLTASITDKLQNAGFTPDVARTQATLMAQRASTRAARMGVEVTGNEFDNTEVRQVLPPALAAARNADGTDLVINALRKGGDASKQSGKSLLEWIAAKGGVEDRGGDITAMGGDKWHREKSFRKKLLKPFEAAQGDMLGGATNDNSLERLFDAAISDGYFPDLAARREAGEKFDHSEMLAAISDELRGNARYSADAKVDPMRAAADELRQMLNERGLDPDKMSDAELRTAMDGLQEAGDGGLEQSFEDGPRGRIQFPSTGFNTGPTIIELFQGRNLSTLLHESGHQWLEELRWDASLPEAPDSLKTDWQTVQDWFSANGNPITGGVIPVEAHEMWARGIERYVMEGKAPSSALNRLFETFRGWLISIYKTVDRLRAPITPEVREVMDRLIATDDEIQAVSEAQALSPLFADAAGAGMTGPEFEAYTAQVAAARGAAQGALLDKTMAAIRRRETKRYKEARDGIEAEVAADVDARPLYRALRLLKAEQISRQWIVDEFGQDALGMLPVRVPPIHKEGGAHPTGVAEMAGYGSGRAMIEALIGAEQAHRQAKEGGDQRTMRERDIGTETDAVMNARYGDPLNDGSIEREALAAVHNDMQGEVIASEIRILARSTGQRPTPYKLAREWARNRVRQGVYATEAAPAAIQRHARAAAKAGREAETAMLAGKADDALRFKQQQMLSSALLTEAKAANDEVEGAVKRMGKIAKQQTSKSIDQDYLDQAHALLEAVDLKQRTQKSIERQGKWAEWAAAREAEGFDVVVPASFEATLGLTNWTRLPTETLLGLDDAVKQVIHLGRLKQTLLDNQERRAFDDVVKEAVDGAGGLDQKPPRDLMEPGWADRFKAAAAAMDSGLLKMETVFDWLDGGNSDGVFNRIAFRPIAEAQGREQDMMADYFGQIRGLFEGVPGEQLKRWADTVVMPFTNRETGLPERLSRKQLIAVALNVGNEGNLQRLADGYGWNAAALDSYLASELTDEEWQFVQGVWDTIDTLWPQIEAMEKRINGIAPAKVEPRAIQTPHGEMRGGYYPVIYDSSRDFKSEEQQGRSEDLFASNYTRANTTASATKARAEKVTRPVLLDLGVINRHLGEVIHDVTHREPVMQAHKFLTDRRVAAAVEGALGSAVRQQMRPWVKFVANSWAMERAGNEGIGKFFGKMRANATAVGMGFRLTTMLTQMAGYSNSFEVVGEKWVAEAVARSAASPIATFNFIIERSPEMRHRMDTLDRDIRTAISQTPLGKVGEVKRFMFHGIGYMDRVVSVPTWLGAYNKALSEGMDEAAAAYAGDKAVRASQGAGGPKDLAAIQRGTGKWGELLKAMTMFYSYFSAAYQRQRTLGRDVMGRDSRRPRNFPKLLARAWWLMVVPSVLPDLIKVAIGASGGPDDDEAWTGWAFKKFLSNALGPIPFARDLIEPVWDKAAGNKSFGYSMSPLQRIGETFVNVGGDAGRKARGEDTKHATKDVMEAAGYATGLVPGQIASATQFLVDVGQGDVDPQGFSDWMEGLTTGRIKTD